MVLITAFFIATTSLFIDAAEAAGTPLWSPNALTFLALHNTARATRGIAPLRRSNRLVLVAQRRCQEIEIRFSHDGWLDAFTAFDAFHGLVGENLAYGFGSPQNVFDAWMASLDHRANILRREFTKVGFAHCQKGTIDYWAAEFST